MNSAGSRKRTNSSISTEELIYWTCICIHLALKVRIRDLCKEGRIIEDILREYHLRMELYTRNNEYPTSKAYVSR